MFYASATALVVRVQKAMGRIIVCAAECPWSTLTGASEQHAYRHYGAMQFDINMNVDQAVEKFAKHYGLDFESFAMVVKKTPGDKKI